MKIRTLKKILKQYKPIIEFRLPDTIPQKDVEVFRRQVALITGNKFLVFVCQIPKEPISINSGILDQDKLEEFRKEWLKYLNDSRGIVTILNKEDKVEFHSLDYIIIHSPFKMPINLYKAKLKQLKDLVNKAHGL